MSSTRCSQPWFNTNTKRICRRKARAYTKAKLTNSDRDWRRFRKLKKQAQTACRQASDSYLQDIITSEHGGGRRLGAIVKAKRCDQTGVAPLKEGDQMFSDPKSKADLLNKQFASVFTIDNTSALPDLGPSSHPTMNHILIDSRGIVKLLKNINPHKASGPDGIPARLLKETAEEIAPAITLLYQASLNQGRVPSAWKKALIVPIFKKGSRSSPANYRPISLTAILSKLCEHVVHSAIINHLEAQEILSDAQHGFRKRRSCDTQLILTINDLAKGIDDKGQTDLILLDFAKAFDKVSHRLLLHKIQNYGVRGSTLKWIEDFLKDRIQQVIVDGKSSNTAKVTSGVPQGSVLGPLLFLVFINDLPKCAKHSTPRLFADDCALYRRVSTDRDAALLQDDLESLQKWERTWMMQFHPSKCQVIRITKKRHPIIFPYQVHGTTLEVVSSAKYLGLHVDSHLNFNQHVDVITKKANSTRAFLQRNFSNSNRKIKEATYKTYVRPITEYAASVWDPHTQRNIRKVEQVQRNSARFVTSTFDRRASVTDLMNRLKWQSLQNRRLQGRLAMLYKIRFGLVDVPWNDHLTTLTTSTRGHGSRFFTPQCSSQVCSSSFFPRTIKDWNALKIDPAAFPSLDAFRAAAVRAACI